jgi:phage/plasmid-like protein (TIGR03299 family)
LTKEDTTMAHNINFSNEKYSMFYFGEKPWHGLGQESDRPLTTWEEMCEHAGLGWEVDTVPLRLDPEAGYGDGPAGCIATLRRDTRQVLGAGMGEGYKPIQNRHAFTFMNSVAAENEIGFHTAGVLGKGERIWMMAKLPNAIVLPGKGNGEDDLIEKNLLLVNWHDGSGAMRCLWTPIRVVCANTVRAALAGRDGQGVYVRHTGEIDSKIQEAQKLLGLGVRYFDSVEPIFREFADHAMNKASLDAYFKAVYPDPLDPGKQERAAKNVESTREFLNELFEGRAIGSDMGASKGTLWGALNSVTEFCDHHQLARGESFVEQDGYVVRKTTDTGSSRRLERIWFGDLSKVKQHAFDVACEFAGIPEEALAMPSLD